MSERQQVVDTMLARARSTSQSESESGGGPGSSGLNESFDPATRLHRQVRSLENEVHDLKRLLLDATVEKKELQEQKDELQLLVDELTGKSKPSPHDTPQELVITDRAKKTMMHLRLERTEEKRKQLQDIVKGKCAAVLQASKQTRSGLKSLRTEFTEQMDSFKDLLEGGIRNVKNISERSKEQAAAAGPAGSSGKGDYLSLVTAAVQEQQKNIVLSPEHPVVVKLSKFLDTFDGLLNELNKQWSSLECFSSGKPPQMNKPRRYIDPSVNLANYTSAAATMRNYVSHSCIMSLLYSDMTLPELERRTHTDVHAVFSKYTTKLDALFDAMRAIRTPVVIRKQSIGNALRIGGSIDVVKTEVAKIQERYEEYCRDHTSRCFKYISGMLCIGRKFAEARNELKLADEWVGAGEDSMLGPDGILIQEADELSPEEEEDLREGGDYHNITRHRGERRRLYIQRRDLMRDFTGQRLIHIHGLSVMVEDIAKALRRHRLISEENARAITGNSNSTGGASSSGARGGGHHGTGSTPPQQGTPQTFSLQVKGGGGGHGGGSPRTVSPSKRGAGGGHGGIAGEHSGRAQREKARGGGGGGAGDTDGSRFRFTAHEQLIKSGQVTSSDFYFQNKRKNDNKFRAKKENAYDGDHHHNASSSGVGGGSATSPRGGGGGTTLLARKDTLSMVRDMEVLQRLSPRKPNAPHAFDRQKPVRMLPPSSSSKDGGASTARAMTTGTMQRPPLGTTATNNAQTSRGGGPPLPPPQQPREGSGGGGGNLPRQLPPAVPPAVPEKGPLDGTYESVFNYGTPPVQFKKVGGNGSKQSHK